MSDALLEQAEALADKMEARAKFNRDFLAMFTEHGTQRENTPRRRSKSDIAFSLIARGETV